MQNRLQSLDVFRGLTIAFMIIVNTPGDWNIAFSPLNHAVWHGFTPTDLVFPSFVFITGVSSFFSFKNEKSPLSAAVLWKIWRRAGIIFLLGVALYAFPYYNKPMSTWRILGVLQRIALCYGIGATLCLRLSFRQIIGLGVAFLLGYWAILTQFGDLTLENNAVRTLDLWLFGPKHLWNGDGLAFDPEGLLSTLPAIVTYFIGYLVGQKISEIPNRSVAFQQISRWAMGLILLGLVWNLAFPINKKLWTSSYVLFAGGLSTLIFALCFYFIDIKGVEKGTKFFKIFGTNAILAYLISEFLILFLIEFVKIGDSAGGILNGHAGIFENVFAHFFGKTNLASLLFALIYTLVCWAIVYLFYRKKVFLKV